MLKWSPHIKLKWILILEAAFAGIYISLTRGLFTVFLVSIGMSIQEISFVVFFSSLAAIIIGTIMYKQPNFMTRKVKIKLLSFHASERITWIFMPVILNSIAISILFSIYMILSSLISMFISLVIYGSLSEEDIRDITAKRTAVGGVSSALGFGLGAFLLAFLPENKKFIYIFTLAAVIGLISTIIMFLAELRHLENMPLPKGVESPEKVFSTSLFLILLLFSYNLLGIFWTPYLMRKLGGTASLAALINFLGTISSIIASLIWKGRSLKSLRLALILNSFSPLIIWLALIPYLHIPISIYVSFAFTGANFLGAFLFANYKRWFGAVKSSILLIIVGCLAQVLSAVFGISVRGNYPLAFLTIFGVGAISTIVAIITLPEIAVIPEDTARLYSRILYTNSVLGYRFAIEISKEVIILTLKLIALSVIFSILYLVYRILWFLIG